MKQRIRQIILLLLLGAAHHNCAQASATDSLKKALAHASEDTTRIMILSELSFAYASSNPDTADMYLQQQMKLAERVNLPKFTANALNDQAILQYYKGDYANALANNKKALEIRRKLGDPMLIISSLNKIAVIYQETANYEAATDMQLQVLQIAEQLKNDAYIGLTLNSLSALLQKVKKFDEALKYSRKAIQIAAQNADTMQLASACNTVEGIFEHTGQMDSAYWYQRMAVRLLEQIGDTIDLAKASNDLGVLLRQQRKNAEALIYFRKALQLATSFGSESDVAGYAANAGSAFIDLGKVDSGYFMLQLARQRNVNNLQETWQTVYGGLTTYFILKNKQDSAIYYSQLYRDIIDTIYSATAAQQVNELLMRYETAEKEQQIEILASRNKVNELAISRRNIVIAIIIISFIAVVGLGILFYNRYRLKQQALLQNEIARQQRLASKAVIAAEELERQRIASDLHDGIGQMFSAVKMNLSGIADRAAITDTTDRHLLENTLALVDESCKEVRVISHRMMPNILLKSGLSAAIRDFINKIDESKLKITLETFGLNTPIDAGTETVLYRIIQESVNNVIKHAGATTLDIQLHRDTDSVSVTVEDNGKGFDLAAVKNMGGIGLKSIEARAAYLDGKVDYDTAPGKGTLVAIYIPYKQ